MNNCTDKFHAATAQATRNARESVLSAYGIPCKPVEVNYTEETAEKNLETVLTNSESTDSD